MNITVVIPGLNEKQYLARVLKKVRKFSPHIVYVDDGSSDGSPEIARKFTPHILSHEVNLGKGASMRTGAEYAFSKLKVDAVIFMDADDQHDPKEIPKFKEKLLEADVVFGVRSMGASMPLIRFLGNKGASVLLNMLYGGYIPDIPSGYKALTNRGYESVKWKSTGYEVETEIAMRVAKEKVPFTTVEIESIYHDTDKGMTALDALHICRCLVEWRIGL
ncbi:MAG: glycosyltransferase family 2 protein [Candidatus Woesebacteria bacterium]